MLILISLYILKFIIYIYMEYLKLKEFNYFLVNYSILYNLSSIILIIFIILIGVAFFTLLERKKLAGMQNRQGPNNVGIGGILQPLADGLKLIIKETIVPRNSYLIAFILCAFYSLFFGLILWVVFPFAFSFTNSDMEYSLLFFFIISIMHVYSIMLAGWSSNSRYSFLGGLRSSAQLIAYDVTMMIVILNVVLYTKSLNIIKIVEFQIYNIWFVFLMPGLFIIFIICAFAETNRHPFDLPEAEAELVAGYSVEYSAVNFSLFFLGEYSSILFMSSFTVNLFLGGWDFFNKLYMYIPFWYIIFQISPNVIFYLNIIFFLIFKFFSLIFYFIKLSIFVYLFIALRAAIPRYRYDQLMRVGWKYLLPLSFAFFLFNLIIVYFFFNIDTNILIQKKLI